MKNIIEKYFSDQSDYPNEFYPPANNEKILLLEKFLGVKFPQDYKDFLLTTNGYTGILGESYVSFSKVEEILKLTDSYGREFFPWIIHIGTNGGGEMYVLDKRKSPLEYGIMPYIGDAEDFIPLGNTFAEFIKHLYYDDFWNNAQNAT